MTDLTLAGLGGGVSFIFLVGCYLKLRSDFTNRRLNPFEEGQSDHRRSFATASKEAISWNPTDFEHLTKAQSDSKQVQGYENSIRASPSK